MSLLGLLFGRRNNRLPAMDHQNDVNLRGRAVGVYISNLKGKPERRLVSFAALCVGISKSLSRYNDPHDNETERKHAWAELEALREIRSNVIGYVHASLEMHQLVPPRARTRGALKNSFRPLIDQNAIAFEKQIAPHLAPLIRSVEAEYAILGASTRYSHLHEIDAFKTIVKRAERHAQPAKQILVNAA